MDQVDLVDLVDLVKSPNDKKKRDVFARSKP